MHLLELEKLMPLDVRNDNAALTAGKINTFEFSFCHTKPPLIEVLFSKLSKNVSKILCSEMKVNIC
jgi:hypothetical protein